MIVALAMPPPLHIVCSPYRPPRCSKALTSVVMIRAPLAPQRVTDGNCAAVDVRLGQISAGVGGPGQHDEVSLTTVYRFVSAPPGIQ
jgi:hypothetical protein